MSDTEEHDAQIRREAIADERAKVVRYLERGGTGAEGFAAGKIHRGEHLAPDRRASLPTASSVAGCNKLRVNGAYARCGA